MLLTEEVEVGLSSNNLKHFEELGYKIPRRNNNKGKLIFIKGAKIHVKVEHLLDNSKVNVDIKCDGCGETLKGIPWGNYMHRKHKDDTYYCKKCASILFGSIKHKEVNLKKGKSFEQWCIDNNRLDILDKCDYELNNCNPKDVNCNSSKGHWFKCLDHPEHISEKKNISCLAGGKQTNIDCHQCNRIIYTNPEIIKLLVNLDDAYQYSIGMNKEIFMKCPNCGCEKLIQPIKVIRQGFGCPKCSDGISYPEKFMFNVLEQLLDKDFQVQLSRTTFKWCENYKYDIYINKINCIVEIFGNQHYQESFGRIGKHARNLEEEQENDRLKEQLAKINNIKHYIIIDSRESKLEWIKNSIMKSELPSLLNFKEEDIDWLKCHEYSCSSLIKKSM